MQNKIQSQSRQNTVARMIEIIKGSPVTQEALHFKHLHQKIDRESEVSQYLHCTACSLTILFTKQAFSPLLHQLLKSCEKFKSSLNLVSSSLSDVLEVLVSLSKECRNEGSSGELMLSQWSQV